MYMKRNRNKANFMFFQEVSYTPSLNMYTQFVIFIHKKLKSHDTTDSRSHGNNQKFRKVC